jgi:hypothetical protein
LLVLIEEDKAKSADDKEFWSRRSPRITAAIAAAAMAFTAAGMSKDAQADTVWKHSFTFDNLYIMRSIARCAMI